ncbi:hypothetical protein ACFOOP_07330 [Marinicaulis aureus]|uniref:Uncharacterized protein n=1 Tax=Hyphococcus aureus TaxID=2666033 RepID=A0ABW1KRA5_9PROT
MKAFKFGWALAPFALFGCGGPVPADMFLTMSVSTQDVAVTTSINGKEDEFLSGDSGSMSGSRPINKLVREGENENEAIFVLTPVANTGDDAAPTFLATLEIAIKGEIVDTLNPGERTLFSRELSAEEAAAISAGESVTITEHFTVDGAALKAMKNGE